MILRLSANSVILVMVVLGVVCCMLETNHAGEIANALQLEMLNFAKHFQAASRKERAAMRHSLLITMSALEESLRNDTIDLNIAGVDEGNQEYAALVDCIAAVIPRHSKTIGVLSDSLIFRRGVTSEVGFLVEYPCAAALLKSGANVIPYLLTRDIREAESSDEHLRVEAELVGEFFAELCPPDMNVADMARAYLNGVKKVAPHNAKRIDRMIDLITKIYTVG